MPGLVRGVPFRADKAEVFSFCGCRTLPCVWERCDLFLPVVLCSCFLRVEGVPHARYSTCGLLQYCFHFSVQVASDFHRGGISVRS